MRTPSEHIREGLAYLVIAVLMVLVAANASRAPHDPMSPDFKLAVGDR